MKRLFILSIAIIILLLSACAYITEVPDVPPNTEAVAPEETAAESTNQAMESATINTEIAVETTAAIVVEMEEPTKATQVVDSVSATDPEPTTPEEPITIKADASDSAKIANLIIAYINEYRNVEDSGCATRLPGLTEYAEYRSRQFFAHDKRKL